MPSSTFIRGVDDFRLIKQIITRFEDAAEDKGAGVFEVQAEDMFALGWARVVCDICIESEEAKADG